MILDTLRTKLTHPNACKEKAKNVRADSSDESNSTSSSYQPGNRSKKFFLYSSSTTSLRIYHLLHLNISEISLVIDISYFLVILRIDAVPVTSTNNFPFSSSYNSYISSNHFNL